MKLIKLSLIAVTLLCLSSGYTIKYKPPLKIKKIVIENFGICKITYNRHNLPSRVSTFFYDIDSEYSMVLKYKKDILTTMQVVAKYDSKKRIDNYEVTYIGENEIRIFDNKKEIRLLTFDKELPIEFVHCYSSGVINYRYNFFYNANKNLERREFVEREESSLKFIDFYRNYDDKTNPFFDKARIWSIIKLIHPIFETYAQIPVSRNNPRNIASENSLDRVGLRFHYTYNNDNFPQLIDWYIYNKMGMMVPIEKRPVVDSLEYHKVARSILFEY